MNSAREPKFQYKQAFNPEEIQKNRFESIDQTFKNDSKEPQNFLDGKI
jgi:hypothetical protein